MARSRATVALDLPCKFGGVSFFDGTASVPVEVSFDDITLAQAFEGLCQRMLTGRITTKGLNTTDEQQISGMESEEIAIHEIFNTAALSITKKRVKFTMSFSKARIEEHELAQFAEKAGRFIVTQIADLPSKEKTKASTE